MHQINISGRFPPKMNQKKRKFMQSDFYSWECRSVDNSLLFSSLGVQEYRSSGVQTIVRYFQGRSLGVRTVVHTNEKTFFTWYFHEN